MRRKPIVVAALAAAVCLGVSACGASPDSDARSVGPPVAGQRAGYPVTVRNCGKDYTYTRSPDRVVVMNGGSVGEVSSLLALGQGNRIIANAQSYGASEVPGRAEVIAKLPTGGVRLNDAQDIPREAMLSLRPDLVISTWGGAFDAGHGYATRQELLMLGANSYVSERQCNGASLEGRQTIEDSYSLLRDLGRIFGVSDWAEALIAQSKRQIAGVAAKVAGKPTPKVMVIIPGMAMGADQFSTIAANGIWNDILAKAGGTNPFAGTTNQVFANLSKEQVAAAPVDAVVVVNFHDPDPKATAEKLLAQFPQWPAATAKRYVVLSDSVWLGPSNAIAVDRIAHLLHPQAL